MAPTHPVVVLPGITASNLRDEYPVSPDAVWSALLHKAYERVTLHPDEPRYEALEPARVRADSVFELPYEELVLELRHNLREREDEPVPVFPFAYDWRQPLAGIEEELGRFVEEVRARTRLLRHYDRSAWSADPRVDLVGHSMGGLVIAGLLARRGAELGIGKVATLGTPFRGSLEAPIKILTGTSSLSPDESASREREAARMMPALYHLLPSFAHAVTDADGGAALDLFAVDAWQSGVIATLAEFVRLRAVAPPKSQKEREERARAILSGMLGQAREHRARVEALQLAQAGLDASRWLAVVGVDATTRVRLRSRTKGGSPRFLLSSEDRVNRWKEADPEARTETGDGTVPFRGAEPAFLARENLVCLSPDDLGYWELADRVLLHPVGWHGLLPKVNVAQRLIVKHLKGQRGDDSVWGRPAPGVSAADWAPPIGKLRAK